MTVKAKIERDAAPPRTAATGVMAQWHQKRQNLRVAVPEKASWGSSPATLKFDRNYDDLKVRGLVFNS